MTCIGMDYMYGMDELEGHAHTGIASDTPVSVHLSPQTTHFGMVGPTLEWWDLLAHLGSNGSFNPLPWMKQ